MGDCESKQRGGKSSGKNKKEGRKEISDQELKRRIKEKHQARVEKRKERKSRSQRSSVRQSHLVLEKPVENAEEYFGLEIVILTKKDIENMDIQSQNMVGENFKRGKGGSQNGDGNGASYGKPLSETGLNDNFRDPEYEAERKRETPINKINGNRVTQRDIDPKRGYEHQVIRTRPMEESKVYRFNQAESTTKIQECRRAQSYGTICEHVDCMTPEKKKKNWRNPQNEYYVE